MGRALLTVLLLSLPLLGNTQTWRYVRHEVSFGVGSSNFLGDLGGAKGIGTHGIKDLKFQSTRPSLNIGYKYMFTPSISLKGTILWGYVSGDDDLTKNVIRNNRNLSFRSMIGEIAAYAELYPWGERVTPRYRIHGVNGNKAITLSPYFLVGIGCTFFNPKAQYNGDWVALQPLGTEGQGLQDRPDKYKRVTMCFPIGIGVKYLINKKWSLSYEMSLRYTLSDYIDDVSTTYWDPAEIEAAHGTMAADLSDRGKDPTMLTTGIVTHPDGRVNYLQRGDPYYNDAYMFAIFGIHYRFNGSVSFIPKF